MFREPLDKYFGVGARLVYMRQARENFLINGKGFVKDTIEKFLRDIERFPMPVSRIAAKPLRDFLKKISRRRPIPVLTIDNNRPIPGLTRGEAEDLVRIAKDLTGTVEAESKSIMTVVLVEKRYGIEKLMSGVPTLLSSGVFDSLPEIAQTDMKEAGKCIALHRSTAAAFHTLRATESMLKKLYLHIVKKERLKQPMWGNMVDSLRKRKTRRPPSELLDLLDGIRRNYRNPTQHPEKLYDIDEAQDLFGQCLAAQNLMYKAIIST
jgi:hypothetical protein